MATFRVEKNKNYTVMSNYHLRDKNLSLKTKGLLSIMLSLPEDWDYSEAGLVVITGEGRATIQKCLHELEANNYLTRSQSRVNGRLSKMEYVIYEVPLTQMSSADSLLAELPLAENQSTVKQSAINQSSEKQITDNPFTKNSSPEIQPSDFSFTENGQQLNKDILNTKIQNTESINQSILESDKDGIKNDGKMDRSIPASEIYDAYKKIIKENISYDMFEFQMNKLDQKLNDDQITIDEYEYSSREYNLKTVNSLIGYMLDILISSDKGSVNISGNEIPKSVVQSKLLKVDYMTFKNAVKELNNNHNIKNPKAYAISMLYNGI